MTLSEASDRFHDSLNKSNGHDSYQRFRVWWERREAKLKRYLGRDLTDEEQLAFAVLNWEEIYSHVPSKKV